MAKAALEPKGYSVLLAENCETALELYRTREPDVALILLDLSMPGVSGKECVPLLRAVKSDSRILICSGFNETDVIREFEAESIVGVIPKPFTAPGTVVGSGSGTGFGHRLGLGWE